jgi:hypothetical protein
MNAEDRLVAAAVGERLEEVARAVDGIPDRLRDGGRVHYFGAGSSGRLAVLDAVECPPTFGIAPDRVVPHLAGGIDAFTEAADRGRRGAGSPRRRGRQPRAGRRGGRGDGERPHALRHGRARPGPPTGRLRGRHHRGAGFARRSRGRRGHRSGDGSGGGGRLHAAQGLISYDRVARPVPCKKLDWSRTTASVAAWTGRAVEQDVITGRQRTAAKFQPYFSRVSNTSSNLTISTGDWIASNRRWTQAATPMWPLAFVERHTLPLRGGCQSG